MKIKKLKLLDKVANIHIRNNIRFFCNLSCIQIRINHLKNYVKGDIDQKNVLIKLIFLMGHEN